MTRSSRHGMSLLLGLVTCFVALTSQASAYDPAEWNRLSQKVEAQRMKLGDLIAEAESTGLCTDYASVSLQVISTFQTAAQHDRDNMDQVRRIFRTFNHYSKIDPSETENLPANEMKACLEVADHAIAELRQQLDEAIVLSNSPDFSQGRMELGRGYFRLDGRTVFPSTITWLSKDADMMQAFGRIGGGYYQLSNLKEDGTVSPRTVASNANSAKSQRARNMVPYDFFIGHSPAGWMTRSHPEVLHGARHFTKYDIDSPVVRDALQKLFQGILPQWSEACGDMTRMHLLANEPHFATTKGGWRANNGVSDHTMRKYREWLAAKYDTVDALNEAYGTTYTHLDQVTFYKKQPAIAPQEQYKIRQIDSALRGGPVWYDWCRFNMDRVNEWFTFLKRQVQANDPNRSPVTIKMLGFTLSRNMRDGGMDIEYLTKLQDIPGADLRVVPRDAIFYGKHEEGRDPETGWVSRYAYDWVEQSMYLDFTKSLCPDKVFYDSEWHGFGAVSWRHFKLDRNYVRSSLWMAFTHGMGAIQPWLWGRGSDGAMRSGADHIGELSTQPVALDAYGRVMKELNAHADKVVMALPQQRLFWIYYCEEAAIQDADYTGDFKDIYEALKLLNLPVGFTTPSEIGKLDTGQHTLIVPPTQFIADHSLAKIEAFRNDGGRIVMVSPEKSFSNNEMGVARSGVSIHDPFAALPLDKVLQMVESFDSVLDPLKPATPVAMLVSSSANERAYGVIMTQAVDPKTGRLFLTLNNVSKDARIVKWKASDRSTAKYMDVITGRSVQNELTLRPCGVRVIATVDAF